MKVDEHSRQKYNDHFSFDDLLVGAPFEYVETSEGSFGGAVYIFYSSGMRRERHENSKVLLAPIKVRGRGVYSQFGLSITKLDNLDGDSNGYKGLWSPFFVIFSFSIDLVQLILSTFKEFIYRWEMII